MHSMHIVSLVAFLLSSLSFPVLAQVVYDSIHNKTSLQGTWASGSKHVVTGPGFANPANVTFTYPSTTGISYSFTNDNFYEIARYQFTANGTQPSCIVGSISWIHGTYELVSNGSIVTHPMGDGFQQVQDPCAATSNFVQNFNITELYQSWRIFQDPVDGYKLHLFQFDGSPLAPQFQVSTEPNMLPTQLLRNVSQGFTEQNGFVTPVNSRLRRRSGVKTGAATRRWGDAAGATMMLCAIIGGALLAL
ncbi:chaperone for protein-folding within the ER, fungal-domain-containing protein [Phellopilus nigrolimitatus]|nr:chaperone for protein-folding within the ER, fungal-domain-containing protein [Phellopilus nigrolimitatus]